MSNSWFNTKPRGEGRVALVTGGGMPDGINPGDPIGFGAQICLRLGILDEYHVVVTDMNTETAKNTVNVIKSEGGSASYATLDVTDEENIKSVMADVEKRFARLDTICNNAGFFPIRSMDDLTADDFEKAVAVNMFGPTFVSKHGIELMKKSGDGGVITIISSDAGLKAAQVCAVEYSMTKAAVNKLAWQICREYQSSHGIRGIPICPGPANTPGLHKVWSSDQIEGMLRQLFSGKLIDPDEVAELVSLASDPKMKSWTLTSLNISGGLAQY